MDVGGGIGEELIESMLVPSDVRCLQRGRIVVAGLGSALAAKHTCEGRTDLVLAWCRGMARRAASEYQLSCRSVPSRFGRRDDGQGGYSRGNCEDGDNGVISVSHAVNTLRLATATNLGRSPPVGLPRLART